jgi:hypothetical protein
MVRYLVSLIFMVSLARPVAAQNFSDPAQLSKVEAVRVVIVDRVKDECLPNAEALKVEAERILHVSGINVAETDDEHPHQLVIDVVGGEMKRKGENGPIPTGACTVAVASHLLRDEYLRDGSVGRVEAYMIRAQTFVMKDQLQQHLRMLITEYVTVLANQIMAARRK